MEAALAGMQFRLLSETFKLERHSAGEPMEGLNGELDGAKPHVEDVDMDVREAEVSLVKEPDMQENGEPVVEGKGAVENSTNILKDRGKAESAAKQTSPASGLDDQIETIGKSIAPTEEEVMKTDRVSENGDTEKAVKEG